ncbi:MAG: pyridoxal-phosphate dependent enzyme, partial [Desulfobacterales bacterium]
MKPDEFTKDIQPYLVPEPAGKLIYRCLGCGAEYGIEKLLYTCPDCGKVLLLHDPAFARLKAISGKTWQQIFDYRKMLNIPALQGIYRFHEFIGPILPLDAIVYLGEGNTPIIESNRFLQETAGARIFFKNDGQNPSASFKDRGMASALSYIQYLIQQVLVENILAVCA